MTARDDLVNGLIEHACCFSAEDAKRMVDAFAHELAEQQRKAALDWGAVPDMDAYDAADLIDPLKGKP